MSGKTPIRRVVANGRSRLWIVDICLVVLVTVLSYAQTAESQASATSSGDDSGAASPVVLDSVVAVVNRHAILASDLDDEMRLSVLDQNRAGQGKLSEQRALEELISRALIEQQIRQEDLQAIEPSQKEVDARIDEIRKQLPACVHLNCASDAGWKAFLVAHGLTPQRVQTYIRYRLEILRFIEERFRQGIQISQQQIEDYYQKVLLPQYAPGEPVPPLDKVASRIQEILLQQQVNVLFDNWLNNLRQQGDVEILDPKLAPAAGEFNSATSSSERNNQ